VLLLNKFNTMNDHVSSPHTPHTLKPPVNTYPSVCAAGAVGDARVRGPGHAADGIGPVGLGGPRPRHARPRLLQLGATGRRQASDQDGARASVMVMMMMMMMMMILVVATVVWCLWLQPAAPAPAGRAHGRARRLPAPRTPNTGIST
jgi:hypothetical protein